MDVAMLELFLEEPVIEDEGDPQQEKPHLVGERPGRVIEPQLAAQSSHRREESRNGQLRDALPPRLRWLQ